MLVVQVERYGSLEILELWAAVARQSRLGSKTDPVQKHHLIALSRLWRLCCDQHCIGCTAGVVAQRLPLDQRVGR